MAVGNHILFELMSVDTAGRRLPSVKIWLLPGIIWIFLMAATLLIFSDVGAALIRIWSTSPSFEHGYVVVAIALALIYFRRADVLVLSPRPTFAGLIALMVLAVLMVAAKAASVLVLQQFILIATIQAFTLTIFGWRIVRHILFPFAYLYFAVPFGEVLIAPLQDLAALLVVLFLNIVDVSAIMDGYLIRLPATDYRIAEACAGLRFFIVGLAVSLLAANLLMRSWWRRLAFLALAFCVPVLANALRAASVIYLEQKGLFDAETLFGHLSYGLGFTSVVLAVLIAMAYFMRDRELATVQSEPNLRPTEFSHTSPTRFILTACLAINVILVPHYWPGLIKHPQEVSFVLAEPSLGKNWHLLEKPVDNWYPTAIDADTELRRSYVNGDKDISIYIAFFNTDRQGAEAVSDRHQIVENNGWLEAGRRPLELEVGGDILFINASKIKMGGSTRLVLLLYWIDSNIVGNPFIAKYMQAKQAIFGGQPQTAVIALSATYSEDAATAAHLLRQYVSTSTLISLIQE